MSSFCFSSFCLVEQMEPRQLFAAVPYHVELAERMVNDITPANNIYSHATPVVTWKGINGATRTYNKSNCSSFTTELLQTAYGLTDAQFKSWTGKTNPQAKDYYAAAVADRGFDGFKNISGVVPGDLMVVKYASGSDTGHVMTITAAPKYVKTTATEQVYTLTIIDSTGSPHGNTDTRLATQDTGVGKGYVRVYTDLKGNLTRWSWNNYANGIIYDPAVRTPIFAHVPPVAISNPTNLFAKAVTSKSVDIRWKDNATNETGYMVMRRISGTSTWQTLASLKANSTGLVDTTIKSGVRYEYRVVATLGTLRSEPAIDLRVTVPQL